MTVRDKVLIFLKDMKKKSISMKELAQALNLNKAKNFKTLVKAVAKLENGGQVRFNNKGKISLPQEQAVLEGIFRANNRGFGFVVINEEELDIFIPASSAAFAMDGDLVKLKIVQSASPFGERGAEGAILEIIHRVTTQVVGKFEAYDEKSIATTGLYGVVLPRDKRLKNYRVYIEAGGLKPADGSVVIVELTHYANEKFPFSMQGIVKKIIGHCSDVGIDILELICSHGIVSDFSAEVLEAAEKIGDKITEDDLKDRRDLRDQTIVTIDGEDAKDLDDAVVVWQKENGNYHLGVHIADVSYYIQEGSILDKEAYERATSIYLADRVIPMLPPKLSNGICSLNPNVSRLAMSCEMEIDRQGNIVSYELFPSVIKTTKRMTYTAVNQILEENNEKMKAQYQKLVPMFEKMAELHHLLEKKRIKRGAIQFEEHEAKIVVDEKGHPIDLKLHERGLSERMIESFMLVANETVAKHFADLKLSFLYRVHEHPKAEKLAKFFAFASMFGIAIRGTISKIEPKQLQQVLTKVIGKPEEEIISAMLLRSMQQARYSEYNYGHYGLAAKYYTHFTSPIRRYPDLIVHRLLRFYAKSTYKKDQEKWHEVLPEIAKHTSRRERRAVDVEREVTTMKKAEYLSEHINEEFSGIIRSVVKFGFFVELANTIEGLVHVRTLTTDHFIFLEQQMSLIGKRTGQVFKLGQKVVVRVAKSDPQTGEIDFAFVFAEEVEKFSLKDQQKKAKDPHNRRKCREKKKQDKTKKFEKNYRKSKNLLTCLILL
ncbi:MAG: ribonuclease R [Streptococcaceae bacterium]|jgi:ribonuclease R|nr:ribonuclease R [Streptococcaceae bacterium]